MQDDGRESWLKAQDADLLGILQGILGGAKSRKRPGPYLT
jgi:hypothetical protein